MIDNNELERYDPPTFIFILIMLLIGSGLCWYGILELIMWAMA